MADWLARLAGWLVGICMVIGSQKPYIMPNGVVNRSLGSYERRRRREEKTCYIAYIYERATFSLRAFFFSSGWNNRKVQQVNWMSRLINHMLNLRAEETATAMAPRPQINITFCDLIKLF